MKKSHNKTEKTEKNRKISRIVSRVVMILMLLVGLAMVLYPTVANRINQAMNGEEIDYYRQRVQLIDSNDYQTMLTAAQEYNARLALDMPYIGELTQKNREEYDGLLNVADNGIIGYIEVPKADVYLAIYHGTDESVLHIGAGHLEASSLPVPGESVHTVLAGHSGLPSAKLFTDLDQLEIGDTFTIHVLNETLTYQVEEIKRVLPEDLEKLYIAEGEERCTLLTCTPYGVNTHRLAVTGLRIETPESETNASHSEMSPVKRIISSRWNRIFVILPPVILACIIITVVLIRIKIKRKKRSMSSSPDSSAEK